MPASNLEYQVFVSGQVEQTGRGNLPDGTPRMWSPISSTLITGDNSAVLVDPPMTIAQSEALVDWVVESGKTLQSIYITHGHGDHWFGSQVVRQHLGDIPVMATRSTIAMMTTQASPQFRESFWDSVFPGQLPPSPVVATEINGAFELEGYEMRPVEVGHSDTDGTSVLHVPSIGLVVAGDAVYNGVHLYLTEGANGGLEEWLKALDIVEALQPMSVVAGHKTAASPDDPNTINLTRAYLRDSIRLLRTAETPQRFYEEMLALHPDRINTGALWGAANVLIAAP